MPYKVKLDSNDKICEFNTSESLVDLPNNILGTHFDSWCYTNGQWIQDPNYVPPLPPPPELRPGRR